MAALEVFLDKRRYSSILKLINRKKEVAKMKKDTNRMNCLNVVSEVLYTSEFGIAIVTGNRLLALEKQKTIERLND